jgi:thymidylate synthase
MLFDIRRNANPYFHIMESIWMLAGRNDTAFVSLYAANMSDFSDDGETLNGAYGYRWRKHFNRNQIADVVELMKREPNTRRAVIAMWDGFTDGDSAFASKDIPCNTHIYFRIKGDKLDMTVLNRSNDIVWGCYGANAVHMSVLQEFVALAIGVPVGSYTQVSNDWHIYQKHFPLMEHPFAAREDIYTPEWRHVPLFADAESPWAAMKNFQLFVDNILADDFYGSYESSYVNWVLQPMAKSWKCYKEGSFIRAVSYASTIADTAVQVACLEWLERKEK